VISGSGGVRSACATGSKCRGALWTRRKWCHMRGGWERATRTSVCGLAGMQLWRWAVRVRNGSGGGQCAARVWGCRCGGAQWQRRGAKRMRYGQQVPRGVCRTRVGLQVWRCAVEVAESEPHVCRAAGGGAQWRRRGGLQLWSCVVAGAGQTARAPGCRCDDAHGSGGKHSACATSCSVTVRSGGSGVYAACMSGCMSGVGKLRRQSASSPHVGQQAKRFAVEAAGCAPNVCRAAHVAERSLKAKQVVRATVRRPNASWA
jgi:hypothetical protein